MLSQLGNDAGSLLAEGQAQRQLLAQIEKSLTNGSYMSLASLRNDVAGAIAVTATIGQQARLSNEQRNTIDLANAQARTRASVVDIGRDIFERRTLDPYLRFSSPEDEAAYREREEENRRAIERALAENTPEGDLRASRIMERQLNDAGAHGADAAPQFSEYRSRIRGDQANLERAIASRDESRTAPAQDQPTAENSPPASEEQLASILATFRAAGIAGGTPAEQTAHGLSVNASAPERNPGASL